MEGEQNEAGIEAIAGIERRLQPRLERAPAGGAIFHTETIIAQHAIGQHTRRLGTRLGRRNAAMAGRFEKFERCNLHRVGHQIGM